MRTTALCFAVVALASVAFAGGGSVRTADGINSSFTLDFGSEVLASRAVPADGSIGANVITRVGLERAAVVFAVADADADAGFDVVFQSTTGNVVGKSKNVGPLTPSTRGTSSCDFQLGVSKFDLVGDVMFSDDGGIVAALVAAKAAHCKNGMTQGVAVWTVSATKDGASAVNGIFLRDMETLESVSTLRSDAAGKGAAIVVGHSAGGEPMSYVIERVEEDRKR
jgi:hypothetical protein